MQQYLPFTVLKLELKRALVESLKVAFVATVLTVYGIETPMDGGDGVSITVDVATVLTVYGIETFIYGTYRTASSGCNSTYRLRY